MHLLRADADLRSEPELVTVSEASRGVDEHCCGVHPLQKEPRLGVAVGDNRLRVLGAICVNMPDGLFQVVNHLDRQDQVEVLGLPVLFGGGHHVRQDLLRPGAATQLHALYPQGLSHCRQEARGYIGVNQQRLHGVTYPGALGLGVDRNALSHV